MHRARSRDRAGGGAPPRWTPARLSPALWFRSDLGVTESGGLVSQWADQSGNARHLTQGTDANKFVLTAGVHGSLPGLRSADGARRMATAAFSDIAQPGTIVLVLKNVSPDPMSGGSSPCDGIAAGNRWQKGFFTGAVFGHPAGTTASYYHAGTTTPSHALAGGFITNVHAYRIELNGASSGEYVDLATAPSVSGTAGAHTLTGLTVGAAHDGSAGMTGDVLEVIVLARALSATAADVAALSAYLTARYSIT